MSVLVVNFDGKGRRWNGFKMDGLLMKSKQFISKYQERFAIFRVLFAWTGTKRLREFLLGSILLSRPVRVVQKDNIVLRLLSQMKNNCLAVVVKKDNVCIWLESWLVLLFSYLGFWFLTQSKGSFPFFYTILCGSKTFKFNVSMFIVSLFGHNVKFWTDENVG